MLVTEEVFQLLMAKLRVVHDENMFDISVTEDVSHAPIS